MREFERLFLNGRLSMAMVIVMGRPRSFDENELLAAAADVFTSHGYEGTSIDDLVTSLKVHRGSLYQAFGSKRGLFLAVLRRYVAQLTAPEQVELEHSDRQRDLLLALDLLLVAALERGHRDAEVAELVAQACASLRSTQPGLRQPQASLVPDERVLSLLGSRIYERGTSGRDITTSTKLHAERTAP